MGFEDNGGKDEKGNIKDKKGHVKSEGGGCYYRRRNVWKQRMKEESY